MVRLASVTMSAFALVHSARTFVVSRHPSTTAGACRAVSKAATNRAIGLARVKPRGNHFHRTLIVGRGGQRQRLCATRMMSADSKERRAAGSRVGAAASAASGVHKLGRGNEIFSLAPMMEYTDRHMRYLLRLLTKRTVLWTEMVPSTTIYYNSDNLNRWLAYSDDVEHPLVLQIGGSDPAYVRSACRLARPFNYDAINLNCGCPSDRVAGKGAFGAALMKKPDLVAELCSVMHEGTGGDVPITVKCRIGVDDDDSYEQLAAFVDKVHRDGAVEHFIIHARKAILGGLSPAENRSVPPLRHDYVYRLVKDFPHLDFTLNGGVKTYEEALSCLEQGAHGVMVGRAWSNTPWYWSQVDSKLFGTKVVSGKMMNRIKNSCNQSEEDAVLRQRIVSLGDLSLIPFARGPFAPGKELRRNWLMDPGLTRREVLERYGEYGERQEKEAGEQWLNCRRRLAKPVWHLFHGHRGGRKFRVHLESQLRLEKPFGDILRESLLTMPQDQVDWAPGEGVNPRGPQEKSGEVPAADDTTRQRAVDLDPGCVASSSAAVAA